MNVIQPLPDVRPFAFRGRLIRPPSVPSAALGLNDRDTSSPLRLPCAGARRCRSPPPSLCCGRNALPTFVNGRGARGRADALAGFRSAGAHVSPSATSRGTIGLPLAARRAPPRSSRATGLPLLEAPNAPRPPRAPLALERASGIPRAAGFCRSALRSTRRTTSERLSSCPRFSSLRACASSPSSLRLISCHLSGISTFRWSTRVGRCAFRCAGTDRIRLIPRRRSPSARPLR
jgi:hypothetical protein